MKVNRLLSLLLCAALLFALIPTAALAAGDAFIVTGDPAGYTYYAIGVLTFTSPGDYTVSMKTPGTTTTTDRIIVSGGTAANPINITLNGVKISTKNCALEVKESSQSYLNLTLQEGTTSILSSGYGNPGIRCMAGATLTINGSGALTATGGIDGAGIGGGLNNNGGNITINDGTVMANGGIKGAGIGGGQCGSGGTITVNGGTVVATGGNDGAGIGGAYHGSGGNITISGGTVTAAGGDYGAGIGGGVFESGGDITIGGGTVTAMGGHYGAGIGGGGGGSSGMIYISGGTIKVTGGSEAEDIGRGINGGGDVTLMNNSAANGGENVYLTTVTLTLDGTNAANAALHLLTASVGYAYGIKDLYADGDGKLYLYLPENTQTTEAQAADGPQPSITRTYTGTVTTKNDHTGAGTLNATAQLSAPTGLSWDGTIPGKATWSAATNASSYTVQLYKGGAGQGSAVTGVTDTVYDFTSVITLAGTGDYTFQVTAIGDGSNYTDSDPSAESSAYTYTSPSNNADLSDLNLSQGTLLPAFAAGITSYTASVANGVATIDITTTLADSTASMKINGNPALSGTAFPINLAVGANTITITVTAQDTSTKTYTLTVTRAPSSPSHGGNGSSGGSSTATSSGTLVTSSGGTFSQNGVTLTFPARAVESDILIQLREAGLSTGMTLPDGSKLLSRIMNIIKDKSGNFLKPVTITLSFDNSGLNPDEYDIIIYYYDENTGKWMALDNIRLNLETGTISGDTTHFTKFAVIATPQTVKEEKPATPVTPQPIANIPSDISAHWAKDSIMKMIDAGVISGYPDGTFKPDKTITRAEFTVMLVKALNLETKAGETFTDTASHWAKDSIATAAAHNIISGYDENTFGPDDLITREQAAIIIARAAILEAGTDELSFTDSRAISPWAKPGVAAAFKGGFITGYPDGSFKPQGNTSRAEAVCLILKVI